MELIHGTRRKASKFAPEDVISNMPDIVITNILDRLLIQDAVRTSILSRNWRFKWTMLSQLVFDWNFFDLLKTQGKINHVRVIIRILVRLRGVITKFVLSIDDVSDTEDINNLILFLSRKGIKDLTLVNSDDTLLKLPTHLFSCLELKHLKLYNCCFDPPPTFLGFPNLLSLDLCVMAFEKKFELGEFFTRCPLLENLTMDDVSEWEKIKLDGIAKLENLKILSLRFYDDDFEDDETMITSSSTIFELLGSLLKLEELRLDFANCRLTDADANKRFSTVFPSLNVLKLSGICLDNRVKLSCAFELISSCPNLQTLEMTASNWNADSPSQVDDDYNTTGLLQLRRVVFECLKGSENELRLIKYLLACSPFLKRIEIYFRLLLSSDEKLMFATKLLKFHRASPVAEIDVLWF
ncbi:F-box/FBD/LRR-repeat protein At1g13570-like [Bidens hawaiensis]|uniref:F-box/FBD/LRR-repeat protein At1g13570-like n=1 Tax=Bidens hawaiensis TaxID=980011 RepID=UPI0040496E5C